MVICRWVCSKEIDPSTYKEMNILAVEVVCKLERAFPPSFFDHQVWINFFMLNFMINLSNVMIIELIYMFLHTKMHIYVNNLIQVFFSDFVT